MKALLALALVAAVLAGCSGTTTGPVTPPKDASGAYIIHMLPSNLFTPKDATVPVGANVTWVHDGGATHNVDDIGGTFVSGNIGPQGTYTHRFTKAGTFHYHCDFHAGMDGTLTVA